MSEQNKALVRRVIEEAWNRGNLEVVDEIFAPDYTEHILRPGQEPGTEGYKGRVLTTRAAFPDLVCDVEDLIAEGDRIALRYTLRGRHDGELAGTPPSGRRMSSDGMVFARFQDGKIVERWQVHDDLGLLQQIGALPTPEASTG
jgi:steroid delta-isomerase-like uncharacterized protein